MAAFGSMTSTSGNMTADVISWQDSPTTSDWVNITTTDGTGNITIDTETVTANAVNNFGMPNRVMMHPQAVDNMRRMEGFIGEPVRSPVNENTARFYQRVSLETGIEQQVLMQFVTRMKQMNKQIRQLNVNNVVRYYYGKKVVPVGRHKGTRLRRLSQRNLKDMVRGIRHPISNDALMYLNTFREDEMTEGRFSNQTLVGLDNRVRETYDCGIEIMSISPWCHMIKKTEKKFFKLLDDCKEKGIDITLIPELNNTLEIIKGRGDFMSPEKEPTAKFVDENYKPSSNDVDITELLQKHNPEFFTAVDSLMGVKNGFRKPSKNSLTSHQKRVKKERRKRAAKSRKTNR